MLTLYFLLLCFPASEIVCFQHKVDPLHEVKSAIATKPYPEFICAIDTACDRGLHVPLTSLLFELSESEDPKIRLSALHGLIRVGPKGAHSSSRVCRGLRSRHVETKVFSAQIVHMLAGSAFYAYEDMKTLLGDSDESVRYYSIVAIGRFGPQASDAIPKLALFLRTDACEKNHESNRIVLAAALAIWQIRDIPELTTPVICRALESRRNPSVCDCFCVIRKTREKAATFVPLIATSLRHRDPYVRSWAAYTLGCLGSAARDAVPALRSAIDDDDQDVRESAIAAIRKISQD